MASSKITEKEVAQLKDDSHFLVTQPESAMVDGEEVEIESLRRVYITDLIQKFKALGGLIDTEALNNMNPEIVSNVEKTDTGLKVTWRNGEVEEFTVEAGGLSFNGGYQDADGYLHLTKDGEDIAGFDPFIIAGGGGGGSTGGSKITFACYTTPQFSVMDTAGSAPINFKFTSVDTETGVATGAGNLSVYVGGNMKVNVSVQQGDNRTIDVFQYLSSGANAVKLVITDSYGSQATRNFTVTVESFKMEWSLGTTYKNVESFLGFYITPTGSGTKTIYTYLDGELFSTDTVASSGRRLTKNITGLDHGMHTIEVYGMMDVGGSLLESNHLVSAVAQVGNSDRAIVAVNWPKGEIEQYTNIQIPYMVVNPKENPSEVKLIVNDVIQSTISCDQSEHVWSYRPVITGSVKIGIMCGSSITEKTFTVKGLSVGVDEIIDGLSLKLDPSIITDLNNWQYDTYGITLSEGFDLVNGGLQIDKDGVHCIRITAGDRLTINYPMLSGDARRTGKEFKFIYKVENSSNKEAVAISCMDGGVGLRALANNVYFSGDQTTIVLPVCEGEKTELDLVIEQDSGDKLVYMWESCSTFVYNQYAISENFSHANNPGITFGSDDADVYLYLVRAYSRDLTHEEIKANYIFDGADSAEIIGRHDRNDIYDGTGNIDIDKAANACPDVHFITVNAPRMTVGKKDTVVGSISHVYVAGGAEHRFTAPMEMVVQGTSSVEHAETAGGNLKFKLKQGITLEDGTHKDGYAMHGEDNSIPITVLNYKKNIASEDHIVNMMCAEWYQRYQPTIRQARKDDPRVRDCLEACMCAVFFHNTGNTAVMVGPDMVQPDETVFFGLGNLCTDKDAAEAFQYEPVVIEVKNNTEPQVRFKSDDLSGSKFDNNFEFRYLDEDVISESEAKALFQEMVSFVHSCDFTEPTNTAFASVQNVNGQAFAIDSAEYRKAKWVAYAKNYFDMQGLYFHHNMTLFHLLRDNRAKNMFWSYDPEARTWSLKFNWDNDTGHCRNNEGYIDIEPGYLDFDTVGTADVFNGADNVIFQNIRECNWDALRNAYIDRESAGAWDDTQIYAYAKNNQDSVCEALWIEDALHNAIRTMQNLGTTAYLERATGRLRLHLKKSLMFQKVLVDSYYNSTASTSDSSSFRGYTPSSWAGVAPSGLVKITPYTDMFINILAGSTAYRERAYAGQEIEIDVSANLNDTEIYLRNAGWIMSIGSLAGLYLGQFEASRLKRVKRLLIGSDAPGYYNTNFTTASFDNCVKLQELNLGGLQNANKAFDLSPNIYLEKIFTKGSGITGITFAKNGRLKEARLNGLASIYMNGLRLLEVFDMDSYANLTSLTVEDSPAVDSYQIALSAVNIARVRLIEIDWKVPVAAYEVLMRLHEANGIDDDGYNTSNGIITGQVLFSTITQTKYNDIVAKMPDVEFTYEDYVPEYTVTFKNEDGSVLYVAHTEKGGSVPDPVASGKIPTPTREPSIEYVFDYVGWDRSLAYVIDNIDVTATYARRDREYTVRFMKPDGSFEVHTVAPHGTCYYEGEDITMPGAIWTGWVEDTSDIVSDLDVHPKWDYPVLPSAVKDMSKFAYAYSDDPADNAAYSFGELYAICKTGQAERYLPIGTQIKMIPLKSDAVKDTSIVFSLHSYGHYEVADGSGSMTNADWYMIGVLTQTRQMNPTNTNVGGWKASKMREWLNNDFWNVIPTMWRSFFVKTKVLSNAGDQSADIVTTEDFVKLPSYCEVGFGLNEVPYKNEVSPRAEEVAFSMYTNNNARIKKTFNNTGTATNYWLRSAWAAGSVAFAYVNGNGNNTNYNAANYNGVCAGLSS